MLDLVHSMVQGRYAVEIASDFADALMRRSKTRAPKKSTRKEERFRAREGAGEALVDNYLHNSCNDSGRFSCIGYGMFLVSPMSRVPDCYGLNDEGWAA